MSLKYEPSSEPGLHGGAVRGGVRLPANPGPGGDQNQRGVPRGPLALPKLAPRPNKDERYPNMAHIRQSRPDSGLDCRTKVFHTFKVVPSSLGSGAPKPQKSSQDQVQSGFCQDLKSGIIKTGLKSGLRGSGGGRRGSPHDPTQPQS